MRALAAQEAGAGQIPDGTHGDLAAAWFDLADQLAEREHGEMGVEDADQDRVLDLRVLGRGGRLSADAPSVGATLSVHRKVLPFGARPRGVPAPPGHYSVVSRRT